jgi:hypothetical protein
MRRNENKPYQLKQVRGGDKENALGKWQCDEGSDLDVQRLQSREIVSIRGTRILMSLVPGIYAAYLRVAALLVRRPCVFLSACTCSDKLLIGDLMQCTYLNSSPFFLFLFLVCLEVYVLALHKEGKSYTLLFLLDRFHNPSTC